MLYRRANNVATIPHAIMIEAAPNIAKPIRGNKKIRIAPIIRKGMATARGLNVPLAAEPP